MRWCAHASTRRSTVSCSMLRHGILSDALPNKKNPSLKNPTSADVRRTASFAVESKTPRKELQRKRRQYVSWSLRRGLSSKASCGRAEQPVPCPKNQNFEPDLGDAAFGGVTGTLSRRGRSPRDHRALDVDVIPTLEPYRREVVAQQPISFGHRPLSASRMFNPCSMGVSCDRVRGSIRPKGFHAMQGGEAGDTRAAARAGRRKLRDQSRCAATAPKTRIRPPGLRAPLLRELLRTDRAEHGLGDGGSITPGRALGNDDVSAVTATTYASDIGDKYFRSIRARGRFGRDDEVLSEVSDGLALHAAGSDEEKCRGDDEAGLQDMDRRSPPQELELRRVFSLDCRPPWDDTPAPFPGPRDSRPAISSLIMPDPEERLVDKLARNRKIAAGVPATASSMIRDEGDDGRGPSKRPSGRGEASAATPRTVVAHRELARVMHEQREKAHEIARRVHRSELRVFYEKVAGAEKRYQDILARGLQPYGEEAVTKAMAAMAKIDALRRGLSGELPLAQ